MSESFTGAMLEAAASGTESATPATAESTTPASSSTPVDASSTPGTPTTQAGASDEGSLATTQTAAPVEQASGDKTKTPGPIPFDAHKTALENARKKVEAEYGWAATIPAEHRQTVGQFYQLLDRDPVNAIDLLFRQAAGDPNYQPQLRSWVGRILGTRGSAQPQATMPAQAAPASVPEPDVYGTDDQGRQIPLYSAASIPKLVDALKAQIQADYAKELAPLKADLQTRAQREMQMREVQEAQSWAEREYTRVAQWPSFTAHEKAIGEAMLADPTLDVSDAYMRIVVPTLTQQAKQQVVAQQQDKARAAGINPSATVTGNPSRPKTFMEAFNRLG